MQVGRVLPHGKGPTQILASINIPTAKTLLPSTLTACYVGGVRELLPSGVRDVAFENEMIRREPSQPTWNWNPSDENKI
jgi:hypothetical protein